MSMGINSNYRDYGAYTQPAGSKRAPRENVSKENVSREKTDGVTTTTVQLKTSEGGLRTEEIQTGFSNVKDYTKYLQGKYSYMNSGSNSMSGVPTTVTVSAAFLKKCMKDPEKAAYLEENLAAIPKCVEYFDWHVRTFSPGNAVPTYAAYQIDDNGEISIMCGATNDPDGKLARENAQRKAKEKKAEEEKAAKRREEKKAEEKAKKKRAEHEKLVKNAEKRAESAKNTQSAVTKVTQAAAESLVQNVAGASATAGASTNAGSISASGFDAKA